MGSTGMKHTGNRGNTYGSSVQYVSPGVKLEHELQDGMFEPN